jgi:hypothetical protein
MRLIIQSYGQQVIKKILDDSSAVIQFPEEIQLLTRQAYLNSFWVVPCMLFYIVLDVSDTKLLIFLKC